MITIVSLLALLLSACGKTSTNTNTTANTTTKADAVDTSATSATTSTTAADTTGTTADTTAPSETGTSDTDASETDASSSGTASTETSGTTGSSAPSQSTSVSASKPTATTPSTTPSTPVAQGSGTKSDPYLIRNLDDLMNLKKVVNKSGYYYKQVANIDCSSVGNWIVIGNDDTPFRHHYDGNGYKISNLCLDGEAKSLFGAVAGSQFTNITIVNAHSKDNHVTYPNNTGKYPGGGATGALASSAENCSFKNCTATVNFQSSNETTGGLVGFVVLENKQYTLMENCHVSGTITGAGYIGGLVGHIWHYMSDGEYKPAKTITVKNCSADVTIKSFTISTEPPCIGGLIGEGFGITVEKCHTTGSIDVIKGDIGGLIGNAGNYMNITRCYSEMDIHASTDDGYGGISIGGLLGYTTSRNDVYNCYATGDISAPNAHWSNCQDDPNKNGGPWRRYYNPCGSLIGTVQISTAYSEDQKVAIYNCYATGTVTAPDICEDKRVYCHGALIGLVLDRYSLLTSNVKDPSKKDQSSWDGLKENYIGHFGNNYNLENLRTYYSPINDYAYGGLSGLQGAKYTDVPTHEYVEIITKAQLTDQATFEGWDFTNVWKMTANGPVLR